MNAPRVIGFLAAALLTVPASATWPPRRSRRGPSPTQALVITSPRHPRPRSSRRCRPDDRSERSAAAAAPRYLCASGADVTTGEGWAAAVLTCNHADSYVRAVNEAAATYAAQSG